MSSCLRGAKREKLSMRIKLRQVVRIQDAGRGSKASVGRHTLNLLLEHSKLWWAGQGRLLLLPQRRDAALPLPSRCSLFPLLPFTRFYPNIRGCQRNEHRPAQLPCSSSAASSPLILLILTTAHVPQ